MSALTLSQTLRAVGWRIDQDVSSAERALMELCVLAGRFIEGQLELLDAAQDHANTIARRKRLNMIDFETLRGEISVVRENMRLPLEALQAEPSDISVFGTSASSPGQETRL